MEIKQNSPEQSMDPRKKNKRIEESLSRQTKSEKLHKSTLGI